MACFFEGGVIISLQIKQVWFCTTGWLPVGRDVGMRGDHLARLRGMFFMCLFHTSASANCKA